MTVEEIKRLAGRKAAEVLIQSGMRIGLGTGSTAMQVVGRLGELLGAGTVKDILVVPTSYQTRIECNRLGIPLKSLNDPEIDGRLDLTIDGADEVDPRWNLIKGGGGAMLIEKVVAQASRDYAIVINSSKLSPRLGKLAPVPVEIIPEALATVTRTLESLGGRPELRMAYRKDGPVITDHCNFILDTYFNNGFDPSELEREINGIPGVVENGIFTRRVSNLVVGREDGRVDHRRHNNDKEGI